MSDQLVIVDLFAGAGGFSEGARQAAERLGYDVTHVAINHWEQAVESHRRNHPDAVQYHSKVEQLDPATVVADALGVDATAVRAGEIDATTILLAGPECTHFSSARGGKPVDEQKRASAWDVLEWLEKLDADAFVIENVPEIRSWGPVEDGTPTRDGSVFDAWINAMNALGYAVDWDTLVAADYGDPTSRERFFLVGHQDSSVTFPEPTHSDDDPDKPDRRTAAEIIDWSDPGTSIWTRDLTEPRVHTPPKDTTMQRIAEGIRRHCDDRLEPFADALAQLGRDEIRTLRNERVVPREYAGIVADSIEEPFLVPVDGDRAVLSVPTVLGQHSNSVPRHVDDRPAPTVAKGGKLQLVTHEPLVLRQQDGGHPWNAVDRPLPTIPPRGAHAIATPVTSLIMPKNGPHRDHHSNPLYPADSRPHHTITSDPRSALVTPYLTPLYNGRDGQRPRTRAVDRPLMTIPASKTPAAVTRPTLIRYSHGGASLDIDEPMPTIATERGGVWALSSPVLRPFVDDFEGPPASIDTPLGTATSRDRFALVVPELWPWGLDVRYRMLQPRELKQAQGFPAEYELVGSKADRTAQIGNAVPVNLAQSLVEHVLSSGDPSLGTFGGGVTADGGGSVPSYEEVVSDD